MNKMNGDQSSSAEQSQENTHTEKKVENGVDMENPHSENSNEMDGAVAGNEAQANVNAAQVNTGEQMDTSDSEEGDADDEDSENDTEESELEEDFDLEDLAAGPILHSKPTDDKKDKEVNPNERNDMSLIPYKVENEQEGVSVFRQRYADCFNTHHLLFFHGTLADAKDCAFSNNMLLGVYLHCELSDYICAASCRKLFDNELVRDIVDTNIILYGWDISNPLNTDMFTNVVKTSLGDEAYKPFQRADDFGHLPILVIFGNDSRKIAEFGGDVNINRFIMDIYAIIDENTRRKNAVENKRERQIKAEETRLLREQQDREYQESMEADRKKMEERLQREENERQEQEKMKLEEIEKKHIAERKEERRKEVERTLPQEPEHNATVTTIRIRLPEGETRQRRFHFTNQLQILLDYVTSQGYPSDEFTAFTMRPRKNLSEMDPKMTLEQLKLIPRETIVVEENDS